MMAADDLIDEWIKTRERLVEHMRSLDPAPKLHAAGDLTAVAHTHSLSLLNRWRTELDELVAGLLMDNMMVEAP